jgi:hypothetical protein
VAGIGWSNRFEADPHDAALQWYNLADTEDPARADRDAIAGGPRANVTTAGQRAGSPRAGVNATARQPGDVTVPSSSGGSEGSGRTEHEPHEVADAEHLGSSDARTPATGDTAETVAHILWPDRDNARDTANVRKPAAVAVTSSANGAGTRLVDGECRPYEMVGTERPA